MSKRLHIAFCFAVGLVLLSSVAVQASAPVNIEINNVDITNFPEVTVQMSVWNENGIPVADLTAQNIFVQEGTASEIHPASVKSSSDADLSVALVMDVSGSMAGQPLADAQSAANRFLDKLGKNDKAAIIAFSSNVSTDISNLAPKKEVGFSSDLTSAYNLVEGLTAGGDTELYNALEKAVKLTAQLPAGHRAILLFTDGKNEPANVGDPDAEIILAKQANIPIFAIGLGSEIDETYLNRLANETGGFYRSIPHSSELGELFTDMATLMKTSYTFAYTSSLPADGSKPVIKVRVNTSQGNGTAQVDMGTLPLSTSTPLPTSTSKVTTASVILGVTPTPMQASDTLIAMSKKNPLLIAGVVLLLLIILFVALRRRKVSYLEKCANCGAELTDRGPCPICGSTKRLKVKK